MWRRRTDHTQESDELQRARAEKERAQRQLESAQRAGEKVDRVADAVATLIRRNHFGESIELAFRKRRTST